ncbi:MAG: hypothetical protein B6U87_00865 [Candidatus Aenigmarchaeota archaeon ex4484_52]|nr:MAG: hypothetical protein B6U87_00865 [Candidatus Aenigmarchaeota archaeon ex4484_52]
MDEIDGTDYKILGILSKNRRISTINLAKKFKINTNVVVYCIKKHINKNIILGFNFQLNEQLIGYAYHKVFLSLYDTDNKSLNNIINYLNLTLM